jgi:ABC-type uncharacterized transport system fused permease/ATPase subunit
MYFAKRRSCKQKLVQLTKGVANLLQTVAIDERCRKLVANLLQTCCKLVANLLQTCCQLWQLTNRVAKLLQTLAIDKQGCDIVANFGN